MNSALDPVAALRFEDDTLQDDFSSCVILDRREVGQHLATCCLSAHDPRMGRIQDDFLNSYQDFGAFESRWMLASEPDWSSLVRSL